MTQGQEKQLEELIRKIPKTDLHVHLDGSVRPSTIIELSKQENLELPSNTVEGLNEVLFKDQYASLEEYLKCFPYSCAVMMTPENIERVSYEFAVDNQKEGVLYVEPRFAPQLFINKNMDMESVFVNVNKGLERAKKEFNARPEVVSGKQPPFNYGIIACAMRNFGPWSEYYTNFINSLAYSNSKDICKLGSLELAKGVIHIRDKCGIPLVGFDIAGAEDGYPAKDHWAAFQHVHGAFMHKTVHAGEAYGAESIFQALTELHADRIGHGYYLFDTSKITDPRIVDKEKYIEDLCEYIADRRITIEVCLTSNLQTNPTIGAIENHNFKNMLENKLSTTFCTDNRTVSKTTVTEEIMLALKGFNLSSKALKNSVIYGFKRSFFAGSYQEKRTYIRQCIDYYESFSAELDQFLPEE